MGAWITLITVVLVAFVAIKINNSVFYYAPKPELLNFWWGPGLPSDEDNSIRPFKINVSREILQDLKERLERHRTFAPPLEGIQQQYGMNTRLLKTVVDYWKGKYNWREREDFLNKYHQFKTKIQGLDIHFIHVKPASSISQNVSVLPLLIVHGWPGSVREFYEIIPMLTTPREGNDFVFEVIAPSIPGYGFSDAAVRPGMGPAQIAVIFKNLMLRLGHNKFYVQGGDWGAIITSDMSALFPEHVLGLHCNMCTSSTTLDILKRLLGSFYPPLVVDKENEHRVYPLKNFFSNLLLETGYMHIQATKPDTVGVALNDSPVSLAAYILEKFITWTNEKWNLMDSGGLQRRYSSKALLDNVMIYWITNSITTSMRLYAESLSKENRALQIDAVPIDVPTACAFFENEPFYTPPGLLSRYRNIVQSNDIKDVGHFAALELPKALADDIWSAVEKIEALRKEQGGK